MLSFICERPRKKMGWQGDDIQEPYRYTEGPKVGSLCKTLANIKPLKAAIMAKVHPHIRGFIPLRFKEGK